MVEKSKGEAAISNHINHVQLVKTSVYLATYKLYSVCIYFDEVRRQ